MTIKTSKYNEVAPSEIKRIMDAGGKIIKSEHPVGVCIAIVNNIKVYSTDDIRINNITLPLAQGNEDYFDCEITIN